ncbi:MAG TPA: hypothetical protein VKR05_00275 [Candidatus Cybelea sp.]|nr:hypothetical protein [Candidatus Cybelea sp.]
MKLLSIAAGELRQRLREPGFLILLVALATGTTYLVPAPTDSYSTLSLAGNSLYGGSAYAGTSAGLDFAVFAGWFCIFALNGGFARDDRTRLSELFRAQPVATIALVAGRTLASWALGAILVIGAMVLLGVTLAFREGSHFEPFAYARNFSLIAFPTMCFAASIAVLLDITIGRFRGLLVTAGLIGYILLLSLTGPASSTTTRSPLDFSGFSTVQAEFSHDTGNPAALSAGLMVEPPGKKPIYWYGLKPEAATVLQRASIIGLSAILVVLTSLLYRRRTSTIVRAASVRGARPIAASSLDTIQTPPSGRALGFVARVATELVFRIRRNPIRAAAGLALFVFAILGAKLAHHWVVTVAMLLPLWWVRAFDESLRPKSLDETLGAFPGGRVGENATKIAVLVILCVLPLLGLAIGNPSDPATCVAAVLGIGAELAWLTTVSWLLRAELLALGVAALWWYVIGFNEVPPPVDYAGLWNVTNATYVADVAFVVVAFFTGRLLLLRRG